MNIIEKTYKWNGKLSNRKSTNRIILHHAESKSCTADDIHSWHLENGWARTPSGWLSGDYLRKV